MLNIVVETRKEYDERKAKEKDLARFKAAIIIAVFYMLFFYFTKRGRRLYNKLSKYMKTTLTILLLLISIGVYSQKNTPKEFVESHLTLTPDSTSLGKATNFTIYNVYFKDCKFIMVHRSKIPFERPEEWEYYCILEAGGQIDMSGVSNEVKNQLLKLWTNATTFKKH